MSSIALLSPAATYGDLFQIANNGQGIGSVPGSVQDGLGNLTNITISSAATNFDRTIAEFQLDGVALTASATTLNNLSGVANANYIVTALNADIPNATKLQSGTGISLTPGFGTLTVEVNGNLAGLSALAANGFVVQTSPGNYQGDYFQSNDTINIVNPDGIAGNPILSVVPDTVLQQVNSLLLGISQSTRSHLNFIPGMNVGIEVFDNPGDNRTDITISTGLNAGLIIKASAYAGTTANLNATYNNGAAGVGATLTNAGALAAFAVDGTSPPLNSRILVKNQAALAQNGIYTLTVVGDGATAWVLTRATDFNSSANIQEGDFVITLNGTVNASLGWLQTDVVTTVGTDPIQFTQFGLTGTVTSVTGTAGEIVVIDNTTTPIISIDPAYVGQTSITTLGTVTTGHWNASLIPLAYGGTNANLTASNGGIFYSTAAAGAILSGTATANQILMSGSHAAPSWSNATYPVSTTINQILYSSAANTITGLATANNGVLLTDGAGVPSIGTATVSVGGTGVQTFTPYSVVCGGTVPTGVLQTVASVGTTGQVLVSNGSGNLPTWENPEQIAFLVAVNQVGHGLSDNQVIYATGNDTYAPAIATSLATSQVVGMVYAVADANNFTYQFAGQFTGLSAQTAGDTYYLSDAVAGNVTTTAPTNPLSYVKPVYTAIDTTNAIIVNQLPLPVGGGGSSGSITVNVSQAAHGFSVGQIIKCTGNDTYALAQADSAADSNVVGIITTVENVNNFTYSVAGIVNPGAAITAGTVYYLDPAVAGGYTSTAPSTGGQVLKTVMIAIDASKAVWLNYIGQVL